MKWYKIPFTTDLHFTFRKTTTGTQRKDKIEEEAMRLCPNLQRCLVQKIPWSLIPMLC
jgi:hypothetical protein